MENTIENKERFFAQYWGQKIAKETIYPISPTIKINLVLALGKANTYHLDLKCLSNYTDEDAIAVEKIWRQSDERVEEYFRNSFQKESQGDYMIVGRSLIKHWLEENKLNFQNRIDYKTIQHITDYLRARSYAVPFDGLSVEEQINYNWIKLKQ